jgi:hypothetical protein
MKEVSVGDDASVLLVKYKGQITAVGNRCTHMGAPLKNGVHLPPLVMFADHILLVLAFMWYFFFYFFIFNF